MRKKIILIIILIPICLVIIAATVMYLLTPAKLKDTTTLGIKIRSQRWSGTITVKGSVYYAPWATLTVEPGTKVLFDKKPDIPNTDWTKWADTYIKDHNDPTGRQDYTKSHFMIYGKILAVGTASHPIVFTSAQQKPEYADWDQLVLLKGSKLEYVEVAYAHNGVNIDGQSVSVSHSKIHDSLWSCIDIFSDKVLIEDNEIYHCWHQSIGFKPEAAAGEINVVQNNNVHDAWLGLNCEGDMHPWYWITQNTFKAAPIDPNCGDISNNNTIIDGTPDTPGGTYNGQLIYPSS